MRGAAMLAMLAVLAVLHGTAGPAMAGFYEGKQVDSREGQRGGNWFGGCAICATTVPDRDAARARVERDLGHGVHNDGGGGWGPGSSRETSGDY